MTDDTRTADNAPDKPTPDSQSLSSQPVSVPVKHNPSQDIIDLFLRKPLYSKIEGNEEYIESIEKILEGDKKIDFDSYCANCDQITPWTLSKFNVKNSGGGSGYGMASRYTQEYLPTIRAVNTVCLRRQHFYTYILYVKDSTVQKIGQMPSMADIAFGELKAIPGINKNDRKELGRALGLFAHDTPLGAFVYLRRVFERMITRAHERHKEKHGGYLENWNDLRMGERIAALADELPSVVQSNYAVWGLLSKGIHELSDNDAEMLFPLVKAVIFEMLGEEERHRQAAIQSEATRKALASAAARFNSPQGSGGGGGTNSQ